MFVLLSFSFVIQSQTRIEVRAAKAYKQKNYTEAIEKYNAISTEKQLTSKQLLNLANSYYKIRDYNNAAKGYMSCISNGNTLSLRLPAYNNYLQSLKLSNSDEDSITSVINTISSILSQEVTKRYDFIKEERTKENPFSKTITSYEIKNLDINSKKSDFGVAILPDSTVMFSSSREDKSYNYIYKKIKQPFINIYKAKLKNDNSIDTLTLDKYTKSSMMHTSSPFYDSLYNRFFYTQSHKEKNKLKFKNSKSNFRIVFGFLDANKQLKKVNYYPEKTDGYSYGHPFFDKKTKRLYFTSDMPGGFGGTDIYYILMNKEGFISDPVNLGEKVNSFANEMFPSTFDNRLYFSSDLFIGKGGLDVYSSGIKNNKFEYPLRLNDSINSSADDFDYKIVPQQDQDKQKKRGYISSNRKGGKGSDDIYSFTEYKKIKQVKVSGFILQKIIDSIKIQKTSITIPKATITISKKEGKIIDTIASNKQGKYSIELPIGSDYVFKVDKKGYDGTLDTVNLTNKDDLTPVSKDFHLIKIGPITFEYDDTTITEPAKKLLKLVTDYLKKYPEDKVKLESHADARGRTAYNDTLSIKRAESVKEYLKSEKVNSDRIEIKGFGEQEIKNDCIDGVKCSDKDHKENRKTYFIFIPNDLK
ncbi:hypothetical protein BTO04_14515 [Polaribacter sp. SA4-10]|nr:hypothetical protein BTO04_14515 [Polaribacter sp. SA4-10]